MNTLRNDEMSPAVELPEIVWLMGHPTVADREMRGTRLRRCLLCNARDGWNLSCVRGMVVHLIDPADIHADPEAFDGMMWAEPAAVDGAHKHWTDNGFTVTRKPGDVLDEGTHPRFRPCPVCNTELMREGRLRVNLPGAAPAPQERTGRR